MQDDRKKTMVLGALFVVIIAVGAFQLRPSGATPPPKAAPAATTQIQAQEKTQAQTKDAATTAASAELPPLAARDPFAAPEKAATATPVATPTAPPVQGPQIHPMSGMIPPMGVPSTQVVKDQALPLAGSAAPKSEPTMTWRLTGVVTGAHPIAVLADATGNQRLIRVGSAIDPDSELTSVSNNSATIVFRGKTLHLFVSGDPNAK